MLGRRCGLQDDGLQLTLLQAQYPIHLLQAGEAVGDHQQALVAGMLEDQRQNGLLGGWIQPFGGFIQ